MKRYNQGFFKFGPMEQCSDGEWVRHEDVAEYKEAVFDSSDQLLAEMCILKAEIKELRKRLLKAKKREFVLDFTFVGLVIALAVARAAGYL